MFREDATLREVLTLLWNATVSRIAEYRLIARFSPRTVYAVYE